MDTLAHGDFIDDITQSIENGTNGFFQWLTDIVVPPGTLPHLDPSTFPTLTPALQTPDLVSTTPGVIGDPAADTAFWHQQGTPNTCAIASQDYVIQQLTGQNIPEDQLVQIATDNGWYSPGAPGSQAGTPWEDCGQLLTHFGLHVQHERDASIADIVSQLGLHHAVMVGVREEAILGMDPQTPVSDATTIPGQAADHMVEVTGIDLRDPANPQIVLNDPYPADGAGKEVPLAVFEKAWQASQNLMYQAW